jgi:hypothetical protein
MLRFLSVFWQHIMIRCAEGQIYTEAHTNFLFVKFDVQRLQGTTRLVSHKKKT